MKQALRNIDTMDEKDWIILRLMRVCAMADKQKPLLTRDFSKALMWMSKNFDVLDGGLSRTLRADDERRDAADLYLHEQYKFPEPLHVDHFVPMTALLVSAQTNDNEDFQ